MPAATDAGTAEAPALTVVIPTFNNASVLARCLESWQRFGASSVELVVVEDGCRDETPDLLRSLGATPWGRRHLHWIHQDDAHELVCTNAGFAAGRGSLLMAWQDDMFLRGRWLIPELLRTFARYPEIGMLSLSRGLNCLPVEEPVTRWEDLIDWRRLQSTIGPAPGNWFRLQEVDAVVRPWVVRRDCLDRVGVLDEAFRPTEWDEADLAFRIRAAGWKVATSGYERLGGYVHLGSSTLTHSLPAAYLERVLRNGQLFHARWNGAIAREHPRARQTWARVAGTRGWLATARAFGRAVAARAGGPR